MAVSGRFTEAAVFFAPADGKADNLEKIVTKL